MPRVFLSHSSKDRDFVERELIASLESNHIDIWYAREDIQTASAWERTILEGLEACDWFLVVMSPRSEASEWVKDEVDWAMEQRPGRIIPVILEACNVRRFHLRMPRIQHIDFRTDLADARSRLLKLLRQAGNDPLDLLAEQQRQGLALHPFYQQVVALKHVFGMIGSSISPRDGGRVVSEADRQQVEKFLARWGQLSAAQQRGCPALLNSLAQLQFTLGLVEAAFANFQTVYDSVTTPRARAAAQHNAYHAALELRDWSAALSALRQAAAGDPERWAPFPLAKYEPQKILGAGGFGVAFLCRHRNLGVLVVIKAILPEELKRNVAEVFAEARALEELDHPALIRIRDGDFATTSEERPFLVLDYFEAENLQQYVEQRGPLTPADLLAVACPLAEALHLAHLRHIFHRDVKPANVLLRREETGWRTKLIDFGLALRSSTAPPSRQAVAGTIDYSAPEQMGRRSEPVGPYSDVYAFGRLCCFALFKTAQPLRKHWQQLPEGLADLLDSCLAEAPAERPQHFGEILPKLHWLRNVLGAPEASVPAFTPSTTLPEATPSPNPEPTAEGMEPSIPLELGLKDLQRMVTQMLNQFELGLSTRPLQSVSIRSESERQLTRELLARFRSLPEHQRRAAPELLNDVGKLQVAAGDFEDARKTFEEVVRLNVQSPEGSAEAHFNAYRATLEQEDWAAALRLLLEACRLAPGRFEPFPLGEFEPQRILGGTTSGLNFLCLERRFNRPVLVTTLDPNLLAVAVPWLYDEAGALARLTHPALLRILGSGYADPERKERPYVVQEYFEASNLREFVEREGVLTAAELQAVAHPAALALQACHAIGVLHQNLNPECLLLRKSAGNWEVKLTGIGMRPRQLRVNHTLMNSIRLSTFIGNPSPMVSYSAPEDLRGLKSHPAADVYSFARLCCYALFATPDPKRKDWVVIPKDLAELLGQCLDTDWKSRPTLEAMVQRLKPVP